MKKVKVYTALILWYPQRAQARITQFYLPLPCKRSPVAPPHAD